MTGRPFKADEIEEVMLGDFREHHMRIARSELARARASDPAWEKHQRFVDGGFNRPIRAVRMFGKIEFAAEAMQEVIAHIWRGLQRGARRIYDQGDYLRSLRIFVPGAGELTGPEGVPAGAQEVRFYPLVPYSRKIELGQSKRAKRGVVRPVFNSARRQYGKSVRLRLTWTVPQSGQAFQRAAKSARGQVTTLPVPTIILQQGGGFA